MCGIAGIIDFKGRPIDPNTLDRLCHLLKHRGPDDHATWIHHQDNFSVGFAHTRLSILDLSTAGRQPMTDKGGRYAVTYNGELYNFESLQDRLPPPLTQCDTETVINACIQWGPDALKRFDAIWALAFVDVQQRLGHLSRDPQGVKPLFYAYRENRLVFASELLALVQAISALADEIDPTALRLYLQLGHIPHPWTIHKSIRKLPPGHRLDFNSQGCSEPIKIDVTPSDTEAPPEYEVACDEVRHRVMAAVNSQCLSDAPLGAFLSGGLDSAIVVGCMSHASATPVKTFSVGYADHPRYDESDHAAVVARHFNTDHHRFMLTFNDILATVEPMLNHMGEPFADSSLLPTALVSRETAQHVKVALSGDGGDELFAGYWRYLGHDYLKQYERIPAPIRRYLVEPLLNALPEARSSQWLDRLRQARKLIRSNATDPIARHLDWARIIDPDTATALLRDESETQLRQLFHSTASTSNDDLNRILDLDLALTLPADMLHKVDLAAMAHSLEVRVPLLAPNVVNYVRQLPSAYKLHDKQPKRILRDAFCDMLPKSILKRKKMGFEVPIGEFLRNELSDTYRDIVTHNALADLGLDPPTAQSMYDDHTHKKRDHSASLWSLFVLCWWKQQ